MKDYVGRPLTESETEVVTNHLGLNAEAEEDLLSMEFSGGHAAGIPADPGE